MNDNPDPIVRRSLGQRRSSRRDMLKMFGFGAGAIGVSGALTGCGLEETKTTEESKDAVQAFWAKQKKTGSLNFANWPLYMDVSSDDKSKHPTLDEFEKESGIRVHYSEVIHSDKDFFAKLHPDLAEGNYTGYDVAIIQDDQYLKDYVDHGYLQPLDQNRMKNFYENVGDKFKHRSYDKDNMYSLPWQAGYTGIAYDPKKIGRKITSWQDLADPKFSGKVGMLGNSIDLPNCALLAIGVDPQKSTPDDWKKAAEWLNEKVKPNVNEFYGQDYIKALTKGDTWISMAYSGDVFQENLAGAKLKFVLPKEKAMFWIDNMVILKDAKHPVDAMELMDFYFKPRVAATLTEYVNYICPVPKAQQIIKKDAEAAHKKDEQKRLKSLIDSLTVFPTKSEYSKSEVGYTPGSNEITDWNHIFQPVYLA